MNEQWKVIEDIVSKVLAAESPQRPAVISHLCGGNPLLRFEVEALLRACERADTFLEVAPFALVERADAGHPGSAPIPAPDHIAGFRILSVLGEGGMGVVYVAEQDKPRRTVALKVIKPGMATPSVLRRFEHEAEVLGRLQHPGIAQVFEAGTTEAPHGPAPFFAMELIDGKPITAYCTERQLRTRDRLSLLARVCDAVQHAHQHGVIHRDLKPSNVLVDSSGQPKILDFGVARVSRPDGAAATQSTEVGQIIGTLAYMSPEQAAADPAAVDTRSDVYSLGVLGYQVLCGKLPLELGDRPLHESVRLVHEKNPPSLASVDTAFRGDIDTVIAKALHKDKEQRYPSAAEFAADIRRVLANEPVLARPPSVGYQVIKFAQRHRTVVGAVCVSLGVLLAATVSLAILASALHQAKNNAMRDRNAAVAAEAQARSELSRANSAIDFIGAMFEVLQPSQSGRDARVLDALNGASIEIDRRFVDEPLVAAELHLIVGRGYRAIHEVGPAEEHLKRAAALATATGESNQRLRQDARVSLALLDSDLGRHDSAIAILEESALAAVKDSGPAGIRSLEARRLLANALWDAGRFPEAVQAAKLALAEAGANATLREKVVIDLRLIVAADPVRENHVEESASQLFMLLNESASQRGENDSETLKVAAKWAALARPADAVDRMRTIVASARNARGDADFETSTVMIALGRVLAASGNTEEATLLQRDAWQAQESLLGEGHPVALMCRYEYASLLLKTGDAASAMALLKRGCAVSEVSLGREHALTKRMQLAFAAVQSALDANDTDIAAARSNLLTLEQQFGKGDPNTLSAMYGLLTLLQDRERWLESKEVAEQIVQRCRETFGPTDVRTASAMVQYGFALGMLNWADQAEAMLVRAYDLLRTAEGDAAAQDRRNALQVLALIFDAKGDTERAQRYRDALSQQPGTGPAPGQEATDPKR